MAKPADWDKLSPEAKKEFAMKLYNSYRGQYIIGQALARAIKVMKQAPQEIREQSNIEDMEVLLQLFPMGLTEFVVTPELKQRREKLLRKLAKSKVAREKIRLIMGWI